MLGHIESYDERCQTGVVKHEGKFYEFHIDQWTSAEPPKEGETKPGGGTGGCGSPAPPAHEPQ